jgi:hypothetical protein
LNHDGPGPDRTALDRPTRSEYADQGRGAANRTEAAQQFSTYNAEKTEHERSAAGTRAQLATGTNAPGSAAAQPGVIALRATGMDAHRVGHEFARAPGMWMRTSFATRYRDDRTDPRSQQLLPRQPAAHACGARDPARLWEAVGMNEPELATSVTAETPGAEPEQRSTGDAAPQEQQQSAKDEVKRRFREALERKQEKNAAVNESMSGNDPSKVHSAHGPAASRRSFRRKSG